jgi:hypothetical protein
MNDLIRIIQENLTHSLLKPEYRKINENSPTYGHCYAASEFLCNLEGKD